MKKLLLGLALLGALAIGGAEAQSPYASWLGVNAAVYTTTGNCTSGASPGVCGSAISGGGAVPTGSNPTLVVDTTAVTANSVILVTGDESLGTKLGVTCNTTITTVSPIVVTARTAGTSFTVQVDATVGTNPACFNWMIIN